MRNTCTGNGWSKSIVLENKMVIDFDFRHGAKKPGHLDHPLQSFGQIYFYIFRYILRKVGWLWITTSQIKSKNIFINDMTWATCGLNSPWFSPPEPPQKNVSFIKCDFSGTCAFPQSFWSKSPWKPCVWASKRCINIFSTSFHCGLMDI